MIFIPPYHGNRSTNLSRFVCRGVLRHTKDAISGALIVVVHIWQYRQAAETITKQMKSK